MLEWKKASRQSETHLPGKSILGILVTASAGFVSLLVGNKTSMPLMIDIPEANVVFDKIHPNTTFYLPVSADRDVKKRQVVRMTSRLRVCQP